ncbi:MAG: prepilin-type N-terminal cleavage/methylation domain-containing protein [Candidatus Methylomirabilales bacterium]
MLRILKNEKGFTLIELVIIIILIGVLAAIAIPRYVDLRDNAVRASAQATLDAGRAAINLDFADKVLNTGSYTTLLSGSSAGAVLVAGDVTALEAELQSTPNYPANGPYDSPAGQGFRWWLVTQGNTSTASPAQPPVVTGAIDLTCAAADSLISAANDDCDVSKL